MHPPRPCRSSSAPAWVIAVPLLAAGCGGKAEPEPEAKAPPAIAPVARPKTAPAAAAAPAPAAGVLPRRGRIWQPEELPEFIGPVLPALDEASRKESEHKSAANDDWPLEALHDEILPHLQRFLAAVLADDEAALTALIRSPDFQ